MLDYAVPKMADACLHSALHLCSAAPLRRGAVPTESVGNMQIRALRS
jgi:hypothetical protein